MVFNLSDELVNQIIFAMEDQGNKYVLDASVCELVLEKGPVDSERYYKLPGWDSVYGFRMMERFVSILRNPLARQELRDVLFCGKGVFRNFKNVLKHYPEVERLWFSFKEKEMKQHIIRWYNALCEVWGLEKLGDEPEDTEDVVYEDFSFREYNPLTDDETVMFATRNIMNEIEDRWPDHEIGVAMADLWQQQRSFGATDQEYSLITEAYDGEFAGFISVVPFPSLSKKTVLLTTLFVLPAFRGLGLGKELLKRCIEELKKRHIVWIIISNMLLPDTFEPCLFRNGFIRSGTGYIADFRPEVNK